MKKIFILLIFVFLLSGCDFLKQDRYCSEELIKCPDGSYVGRIGPNCEFASCPGENKITDFTSCVAAGYPVMESYPRQCRVNDQTFIEVINGGGQICTQEAKLCPDGSYVSRSGPDCEFSPCPGTGSDLSISCQGNNGNWLEQYNECEYISQFWCEQNGGIFKECESACRHDPRAEVCTLQCVPVCEFNANTSGLFNQPNGRAKISGRVLLGPTCPVEKYPPDPACADKPYKTTIQVIELSSFSSQTFAQAQSNDQGYYEVSLPPGQYALQPIGGTPLPRCETKEITVESDKDMTVDLSCDTGIR